MDRSHFLRIGGIGLSLHWTDDDFSLDVAFTGFEDSSRHPDVALVLSSSESLSEVQAPLLFDSGGVWRLSQLGNERLLEFRSPLLVGGPYLRGVFDPGLTRGEVSIQRSAWKEYPISMPQYPLDELLIINALWRKRGVVLHAALVDDGGCGWLFTGQSGAGKSTISALWERSGVDGIYSDDRVIVREHDGQFWAYGTPWHGTGRYAAPFAVRLGGIFVLSQTPENSLQGLPTVRAVSRLLARAFPPFWDAQGMEFTVAFLEDLCRAVPCYDLGFQPTEAVVDFVRTLNDSG